MLDKSRTSIILGISMHICLRYACVKLLFIYGGAARYNRDFLGVLYLTEIFEPNVRQASPRSINSSENIRRYRSMEWCGVAAVGKSCSRKEWREEGIVECAEAKRILEVVLNGRAEGVGGWRKAEKSCARRGKLQHNVRSSVTKKNER